MKPPVEYFCHFKLEHDSFYITNVQQKSEFHLYFMRILLCSIDLRDISWSRHMLCSEFFWSAVINRMKYTVKMAKIIKTALVADFRDIVFVGKDQLAGIHHTLTVDIFSR